MFDARGWLTWLLSMAILALLTRNPLYLLLILLVGQIAGTLCARPAAAFSLPLARLGIVILFFSTLFNLLSVHIGSTVLLRLPLSWPVIGGPLTLEAALFGAVNGLVLLTLLVIFTAFNRIVPPGELVRLAPHALRDLAVVVLIAMTYLPETMRQLRRIREAQAIRGHQLRGLRDWPPLVLPLLIGGLERAMGVAEAMVSRGYGSTTDNKQPFRVQLALFLSLCAVFAGWSVSFWYGIAGWTLMGVGTAVILLLLHYLGRQQPTTRYQPRKMTAWNWGLIVTALIPPLLLLWNPEFLQLTSLSYSPYPTAVVPPLQTHVALILLLPLFPALTVMGRREGKSTAAAAHSPLPTAASQQKEKTNDFP